MRPYHEQDGITIYHGDCRELLPGLTADVAITDPPYGVNLVTKTSDYRQSEYFNNGESLRASITYDDDPAAVRVLIRRVMPVLLSSVSRAVVFSWDAYDALVS